MCIWLCMYIDQKRHTLTKRETERWRYRGWKNKSKHKENCHCVMRSYGICRNSMHNVLVAVAVWRVRLRETDGPSEPPADRTHTQQKRQSDNNVLMFQQNTQNLLNNPSHVMVRFHRWISPCAGVQPRSISEGGRLNK